jgi:5-formyltetrahydrofolate cyclo-ligase
VSDPRQGAGFAPAEASLAAEKAALRQAAFARRRALSPQDRQAASAAAAERALPLLLAGADPIAAYWPRGEEIDPRPLIHDLQAAGRSVVLPATRPDGLLEFRLWRAGEELHPAGFSLLEPAPDAQVLAPRTLLVPLVAFDRRGHRLGHGKGYYDRALAALSHQAPVRTIGFAFSVQEMASVPAELHDMPLDLIVTERETIEPGRTT